MNKEKQTEETNLAVSPKNYRFIIVGLMVMVAGYILMIGGGSNDPNVFNYSMFNFTRTVLSPCLFVLGVVIIILAIMRRPAEVAENDGTGIEDGKKK
ncbi:MAG: DUF3098 domain-containing protein [Bacteroidales bacterium]|jgi:hypothetical protein|nr:DUF3098 domain-containing protein [Bacteroidales bacterium]MCI2121978.1 DUF3098 domain-containing protein [Bacteroidales bacterium]MCI2146121.1 DUF3098 domain-containing protein [Bacteroidales bacterium]